MRFTFGLVLALGAFTAIQADDMDTRFSPILSVGYAPSVSTVDHAEFTDKGAISLALGTSMHHVYPNNWGCVVCADIFDTYGKSDGDQASVSGVTLKTNELGFKIGAGPVYRFMPQLSLALIPYVGLAWTNFAYSGGGISETDNGVGLIYGGKLALSYTIDHGLRVGIYGGVEGSSTRERSKATSTNYTATGAGPVAGVSVAWMF